MADLTLTGVTADGTITGTAFTRTTTLVLVDDQSVPFEFVSDTELKIEPPAEGAKVVVTKGGIESEQVTVGADQPAAGGDSTAPDAGAAEKTAQNPPPAELGTYEGGHLEGGNYNEQVHQTPVQRIHEDLGIDVRDPYPTGNPPDPREAFYQTRGFYPPEDASTPSAPAEPTEAP